MTGYQEVLSDPSYEGQVVTMAYPLIGNYGVNGEAWESSRPHVAGFVVGEAAGRPNHWRSEGSFTTLLARCGVVGIAGVDTRCLVRHLRTHGLQRGVVSSEDAPDADLVARARALPDIGTLDLVGRVSTPRVQRHIGSGPRVAVLDCGVKWGIVENLRRRGCDTWVLPHRTSAEEILDLRPAGLVLSPGPGDPKMLAHQVAQVRRLPIISVQYHPEGRPGPLDSAYLFEQWMSMIAPPGHPEAAHSGAALDAAR